MKTAISTTFITCLLLSSLLTVVGLAISKPLMRMINTPDNIFAAASIYLNIYIGGLSFLFLYNICTGIFTALGDSRTPLYFLIGSSLGNIFIDWFFVAILKMGVAGVAWATFLCQGISCILSIIILALRMKSIKTGGKRVLFSGRMFIKICYVAIPSILQQSFISVGNILIQSLVNGYGSAVIAGYSAAIKLNTFAITSFTTLANGLSSFTAQNIGANKPERVRKGFRAGSFMGLIVAFIFFGMYFLFYNTMLSLFLNAESDFAMQTGIDFLRIVSPFYFSIAIKQMGDSVLRGAGAMGYFMVATFVGLLLRIIFAYVFEGIFGEIGIWLAWPIGWVLSMVISLAFYFKGVWKRVA